MPEVWKKVLLEGDAAVLSDTAPVDVTKSAASEGTASEASRQDHKHDISTTTPGTIAENATPAEGTSTSLARADHTHGSPASWTPAAHKLNTHSNPDGAVAFAGQQATDLVLHNAAANPTAVLGKIYFKTGDLHPYVCTSIA